MQRPEKPVMRLVTDARTGDEQAFADLVRGVRGTLYSAALSITKSTHDAEDAVAESVLRAWDKLGTLKEPLYFNTWITRITIRTAININRRRKPGLPLLMDVSAPRGANDEQLDVRRAIEQLDEKTRIATVLYYFEDMSVDEISRATGARPGTIKSRLFRARAKLRDVLEGYGDD